MKVTDRKDWADSLGKCHRFFTGQDHGGSLLEARIEFYLQMLDDRGLVSPGKEIVDLGVGQKPA